MKKQPKKPQKPSKNRQLSRPGAGQRGPVQSRDRDRRRRDAHARLVGPMQVGLFAEGMRCIGSPFGVRDCGPAGAGRAIPLGHGLPDRQAFCNILRDSRLWLSIPATPAFEPPGHRLFVRLDGRVGGMNLAARPGY